MYLKSDEKEKIKTQDREINYFFLFYKANVGEYAFPISSGAPNDGYGRVVSIVLIVVGHDVTLSVTNAK